MPALSSMLQILCEIDLSLGLEMVDRDMHININSLVLEDGSADKCIPYKYGDLALILRTHEKKTGAAVRTRHYQCWGGTGFQELAGQPVLLDHFVLHHLSSAEAAQHILAPSLLLASGRRDINLQM